MYGAVNEGDAKPKRGVVEEVSGVEVVAAVDDEVVSSDEVVDVVGGQAQVVGVDVDVGVERAQGQASGVDLGLSDAVVCVEDLSLEVGAVDEVAVDEGEVSDASGCEVEGGGGAEAAGAEEKDAGVEEGALSLFADLRDEEVSAVAGALIGAQGCGDVDGEAVLFPGLESTVEGGDVEVAELREGEGGEG